MPLRQNEFKKFIDAGLSPIPLKLGTKRPLNAKWQHLCDNPADAEQVVKWESHKSWNGGPITHIGLCCGTLLGEDKQLISIDIDNDDIVTDVLLAIGDPESLSGKKGAKGVTIFAAGPVSVKNKKIKKRLENGRAEHAPSVEILAHGCQTVVPPSIHPDTNIPYVWTGTPLYDIPNLGSNLPIIDKDVIDEIEAICHRKAIPMQDLNEMVWLGSDKGGNTHDSCVVAVGWMVSHEWANEAIHRRIERAKRQACDRNGNTYNWPHSTHTIQEWIDSAKAKGMEGSAKKTPKRIPAERIMAEWGIEQLGGVDNVVTVRGQLRSYEDGHYKKVDIGHLQRMMFHVDDCLKERDAKTAISIMHTLCERENFGKTEGYLTKDDPKMHRLCLKNGTINLRTGELLLWDRDHELLHQTPIDWADEGECPLWDETLLLSSAGDKKWIATLQEFFGLTLVPDMSFQMFMFLLGPGGNGKGTVTSILSALHDPSALGSVSITDLGDERKRTSLAGTLLNMSGEQSRLNLVADVYLKKITGEDPVDTRKLYGETNNNVYFTTRFLESVNEMPSTSDNSHALRRRMLILKFMHKIEIQDPNFKNKIIKELPVILSKRLIPALADLYVRGVFDPPASSHTEIDVYMKGNDPVALWFDERCLPCDRGTGTTDLYEDFKLWAGKNGYSKPFTSIFWGQQLNRMGYEAKIKKIGSISVRSRMLRLSP